jgi:hypothetical protein
MQRRVPLPEKPEGRDDSRLKIMVKWNGGKWKALADEQSFGHRCGTPAGAPFGQ